MAPLSEIWEEIANRPSGPFAFRFYLQPMMAALFAVRDGIRDARARRPPYLETLFREKTQRRDLMRDAWGSIGRVFVLAFAMDVLYQLVVLRGVRPVQALLVSVLLAILPYALLRGPTDRVARRLSSSRGHERGAGPSSHAR